MVINDKQFIYDTEGLSIEEIIAKGPLDLAGAERGYYIIREESSGYSWLHNICTENVLDGLLMEY